MARAEWKLVTFNKIKNSNQDQGHKVFSGEEIVKCDMIGNNVSIYNGRNFKKLILSEKMIGHKIGVFAITRRVGLFIHEKKKGQKLDNKNKKK